MTSTHEIEKLAIEGGSPAVRHPLPAIYPGGMRLDEREEQAVLEVIRSKRLFRYYGPQAGQSKVAQLEESFARYMGAKHALAVASGTTALTSALAGLGVGPGDEVIVPAYTWISTAASVVAMGAVPIVAEVDDSLTLDPVDFGARITSHTKAVIPVHMRGTPCDMDAITQIARQHDVAVLEDTAQADGASYHGQRLGTIGDVGIFSLQFNKILTAGEGGMVITDDQRIYERALMYHDVAGSQRGDIPQSQAILGINCRLSELQGAVMLVQLEKLQGILTDSRRQKRALKDAIRNSVETNTAGFRTINDTDGEAGISLAFYGATVDQARWISTALRGEGVHASVLFSPEKSDYHIYYHWAPILNKRYWADTTPWDWHQGEVSYSQDMCSRSLDLLGRAVHVDISPDLTDEQVQEVASAINKVLSYL